MKQLAPMLLLLPSAAAAELPRRSLESQVRYDLIMLPYYGAFDDLAQRAIHIIFRNGHVTVPGVHSVTNELAVDAAR